MKEEDEDLLDHWFLIRNLSTGTQESYRIAIRDYSKIIGKNPKDLIDEAEEEEDAGMRPRKRKVTHYLLKFKKHLENKGIAPGTLSLYVSAVRSFYKAFDITLPEIKLDQGDIGLEKNIGKRLTRNDLHKLISAANHRERALIYLMTLTGMGQQEARDLKIKKLLNSAGAEVDMELENVYDLFKHENQILREVLTLEITRKKSKIRHHTFLPPEATREILSYLKERCYGRNEKVRVINIDDYIFVNNVGNQLSRDSIVTNFRRIGQQAGFQKEDGAYSFWRSHALRKYFISNIINKIGEKIIADYMAGHKINNQDRTYWQANPDDLKQHYLKALPYLSIDEAKIRDYTTKEFEEIMEDSKHQEAEIIKMKNQMKIMQEMITPALKKNNKPEKTEEL